MKNLLVTLCLALVFSMPALSLTQPAEPIGAQLTSVADVGAVYIAPGLSDQGAVEKYSHAAEQATAHSDPGDFCPAVNGRALAADVLAGRDYQLPHKVKRKPEYNALHASLSVDLQGKVPKNQFKEG